MASQRSFVDYVCQQMARAGAISARPMFGEYAVYLDRKLVALICDDQLFVKATPGGNALAPDADQVPPYPGAKPSLLIADGLDDPSWLAELITTTARELPAPKPTKAKP